MKFGTGILTRTDANTLDTAQFRRLVGELAKVVHEGRQCLLVSSGAVGAGMMVLGHKERPVHLPDIQACAAVGQSRLMRLYQSLFARHRLHVAQLLLTHQDLDSRTRFQNARNTLECLLARGDVVPIINENDSVAVEELKFSDNDRLSAEVATLANAELLVICTSANGLTATGDPNDPAIPVVEDLDSVLGYASGSKGRMSVGGMASKLMSVRHAVEAGIPTTIINGRTPGALERAMRREPEGTQFLPKR